MDTNIEKIVNLNGIPKDQWRKNYIGDGYRSCTYKEVKIEHANYGEITLFGYDRKNNPCTFICDWEPRIKYIVKFKTDEKDIYGRYVKTNKYRSCGERKKNLESITGAGGNIVECLPPVNEFLHEVFDDVALDENFNKQKLRIHYFDIETEISESFEGPETARNRINMITVYDTKTEKYYTWSLQEAEVDFKDEYDENGNLINECPLKDTPKEKFEIRTFEDNERIMLMDFVEWFEKNYPDVLCGFNSQAYDLPYIVNRIERVLGNPEKVETGYKIQTPEGERTVQACPYVRRLSPVGKVRVRKNNLENERANKQAPIIVDIDGIFSADVLVLYRDKYKINQPLDGGNGLDNIGEVECGIHKIHYKGTKAPNGETIHSLRDLYEKDWQRFYKYNVMDVEVLKRVEEKVKTIPLSRSITSAGLSNYEAIYSSIGYLIGSLIMFAKTQMGTVFTSYQGVKKQLISYEGAYVFPPTQGLYRGGVSCVDFNSLYPNSIIASNVSPETYVGKISRFPIDDPTMEIFTKEPPIDLTGTDTTVSLKRTDDEIEYSNKFKKRFGNILADKDIKTFYLLKANGEKKTITREQLDELIRTKCIFTRNNTLFYKHSVKQGVISAWSEHFYKLRKTTKKKGQKLALDLHNGLITENIDQVKEQIQNLDNNQQARKISLNSIYGCLATPFSAVYNSYIAQTITRTGKFCNQSASEYIRKCFKERFGIDDSYVNVTSGDTDSSFRQMSINIKR